MCTKALVAQKRRQLTVNGLFWVVYQRSGVRVSAKSFRLAINGMNSKLSACYFWEMLFLQVSIYWLTERSLKYTLWCIPLKSNCWNQFQYRPSHTSYFHVIAHVNYITRAICSTHTSDMQHTQAIYNKHTSDMQHTHERHADITTKVSDFKCTNSNKIFFEKLITRILLNLNLKRFW